MSLRPPPPRTTGDTPSSSEPKLPGMRRKRKAKGIWSLVWPLLREQKWWIAAWIPISGVSIAVAAASASALQSFVDEAVIAREISIAQAFGRIVFLTVLASILGIPSRLVIARVLYHLEYTLKNWLYDRLQAIDPRRMDAVASGQLITRANTDLGLFEAFLLVIPALLGSIPLLIGVMIILFTRSVPLALLAMAAIPLNILLAKKMAKPLWGMSWMHLNRTAQVTTVIDENVRGIRTVKAFGREDEERLRLADTAAKAYGVRMEREKFVARYDVLLKVIPVLMNVLLLLLAARLIIGGSFTVGAMLVFLRYSRLFTGIAQGLDSIISFYQYAKTAAGRIYELIFGDDRRVERGGAPIPDVNEGMLVDGVSVGHNGKPVLDSFTLELRPGELVVVQGGPGSGKSTIASLLNGDLAADSGEVFLEDWDVQKLHPGKLRREVRVLNEEPFLFGRTARENLEMGGRGAVGEERPRVDEADLNAALRAARADEIVEELGNGLDTVIGDRGLTLSGGQRQRLGLARALVSPPRILVLDDALLAVNPAMEAEIIGRIRAHAPQTSILVLTRRSGLEQVADRTIRLPGQLETEFERADDEGDTMRRDAPYSLALASIVNSMASDAETKEKPPVAEQAATLSDSVPTVLNLLSPIKVLFGFVAVLALVLTAATLVPNLIFRDAVDAIQAEDVGRVNRDVLWMLGVAAFFAAVVFFNRILRTRVSQSIFYQLRRRTFQRITRLGIDFYDRELPGQTATRVTYDIDKVESFVEDGPYRIVNMLLLLTGTFVIVFIWNATVGMIALGFVPVLIVISAVAFPLLDRLNQRIRLEVGRVNERLQEDFIGRYAIHTYGTHGWARTAFRDQTLRVRTERRTLAAVNSVYNESFELALGLAAAFVLRTAGGFVNEGVLTTGTMTAVYQYVDLALAPLPALASTFAAYLVARASFLRLREPFTTPILPVERSDARDCSELDGEIRLDGVSFTYPGTGRRVLEDVTLHIEAGEVVALVGPTGAGKSSIAKIVQRMYDPDEGAVVVDGADLREYKADSYRRRLGIVPQEVFCFRGTVLSNATYGRSDATVEDVEQAAREVGVLESLRAIPGQWTALVDEEGRNLTAGQRQMIGIVRAWLTDPDILIFDEATATLSEELERDVLEAIETLDRTTIFITHRLAVARSADRVVVVDEGRIVETGKHSELIRSGGPYARLWAFGTEVSERAMAAATGRKPRKAAVTSRAKGTTTAARKVKETTKRVANGAAKRAANGAAKRKTVKAAAPEKKPRAGSRNGPRSDAKASKAAKKDDNGQPVRRASPAARKR